MNPTFPGDAGDLKEKAGDAFNRVKETVQEKVVDPVVQAARDGAAKAAEFGRQAASSTNEWVGSHPYPTAGFAFLAGVLLGVVLGRQSRW